MSQGQFGCPGEGSEGGDLGGEEGSPPSAAGGRERTAREARLLFFRVNVALVGSMAEAYTARRRLDPVRRAQVLPEIFHFLPVSHPSYNYPPLET